MALRNSRQKRKRKKKRSHERQIQKKREKHRAGISLKYIRDIKFVFFPILFCSSPN